MEDRYTPQYKTAGAACCDLVARIPPDPITGQRKIYVNHRTSLTIGTGISVAIPPGYKICVSARSGLAKRGLICTNAPGQIDSDYRDEMMVIVNNVGREIIELQDGKRFAQCWVEPVWKIKWNKVDVLPPADSERKGGFGSTGDD